MPNQIARSFALVNVGVLQLLFVCIGLVESRPKNAASPALLQYNAGRSSDTKPYYYMRQQQPLLNEEMEMDVKLRPAGTVSRVYAGAYLYRSARVQVIGDTSVPSRKLGRLQALLMQSRCLGVEQWIWRASTQDLKMGRSYRRLLVGRSLQEELQALWFKCHPHIIAYDDDDINGAAGLERDSNIPLMELISTYSSLQSRADYMVEGNIMQAFLLSHPSFFLQLALAFLLLAFLASIFYFSLD